MIRYFAAHPTIANLMMVGFLAIGAFSLPTLQRETFPRLQPDTVEVSVNYPGARPEDVEEAICRRLEEAVDAVNNVKEVACESRDSLARMLVSMTEGHDLDRFFADITTEVEAISDFPEETEEPIARQLGRTDFVAAVAITGPTDQVDLKALAEDVRLQMQRHGGIPKIEILGFSDHQIRIQVRETDLRRLNLSIADLAASIERESLDSPAGSLKATDGEIALRYADERRRVQEFEDLVVVTGRAGGQIRLGDIATITDRFEKEEVRFRYQGQPSALLNITKTANEDTLDVIARVKDFLAEKGDAWGPGVKFAITNDVSSIVQDRLDMLISNGLQGLALVFIAMLGFFGLRYSFWITMGLPVSFMGGFAVMVAIGYSVNMATMVGLLIVIGLLMDDAIVISENIASEREKGKPALTAAVDGAKGVLPGVVSSFLTTTAVFGSLAFLTGDIGQFLRVVPVVMIAVLLVSLVEAFLILPNHLSHSLLKNKSGLGGGNRRLDNAMAWMRDRLTYSWANWCVRWRYLTVGVAVMALLLAVAAVGGGVLKFVAFPNVDGDTLEARILLPSGTALARTEAVVAQVVDAAKAIDRRLTPQQPGQRPLIVGITEKFNVNSDANGNGPNMATVVVDLMSGDERSINNEAFLAAWREEVGRVTDVISLKFAPAQVGLAGLPIDLQLKGDDLSTLKAAAEDLKAWLAQYRGVSGLLDDLRPGKPEMVIRLTDRGRNLGLTGAAVADQLRKAYFGTTISVVQVGPESYEIDLRYAPDAAENLADLDYFAVATPQGDLVPLSEVAEITPERGFVRINRVDGQRTVTIQGEVDSRLGNAAEIIADTSERFLPELFQRYPDVSLSVQGQNKEAAETARSMLFGITLGLIGVFLILSFQFRSYVEPIVVMTVIPFSLIGVVGGHLALGIPLSMPSMLGLAALAGVVVNNAILLIEVIKETHREGLSVADVAAEGSRARFRAIFLTTVTTTLGMAPLLAETSLQAQVLIPMVASLTFGLIVATLFVLFVVPAFYAILDDFGLASVSHADHLQEEEEAYRRRLAERATG